MLRFWIPIKFVAGAALVAGIALVGSPAQAALTDCRPTNNAAIKAVAPTSDATSGLSIVAIDATWSDGGITMHDDSADPSDGSPCS
jgi:hypothetical protein